jgi:hypothetical protein
MPEAITKYAINSTLGTEQFRPLDQIIIGQKRFVVDETVLCASKAFTPAKAPTSTAKNGLKFIPELDGSVKIDTSITASGISSQFDFSVSIKIFQNGLLYSKIEKSFTGGGTRLISIPINIDKHSVYEFSVSSTSSSHLETQILIKGSVQDANYFSYVEVEVI